MLSYFQRDRTSRSAVVIPIPSFCLSVYCLWRSWHPNVGFQSSSAMFASSFIKFGLKHVLGPRNSSFGVIFHHWNPQKALPWRKTRPMRLWSIVRSRLWAGNSPPSPRVNFRHYYFLIAQCLLNIFYLFCNLAIGAFGSYRGQRSSSGALLHIVYYLTTMYVAFSCHFLNLVGQIIFLMI